ncbi:tripartite motif containing 108 [Pygocentrus nattereri]|uniref:RING-type E3 ubiquitin transferase n=1 Tax=Pygocentrus nattereri TaxID=42514 RepID=A0AAR2JXU6_PYGNA|nr:tripartite motif containing 108 [Pygocentrus nattereri]
MASQLSWEIKCSLCLDDFTDPITLSCEHSFCRQCITGHLQSSLGRSFCPDCQKPYKARDLRPSRLLRNVTAAVREHLTVQEGIMTSPTDSPAALTDTLICFEHDEKLKLFCETDQKLVCVVCRDGQKHKGHQFKPVKEAAQMVKGVVKGALGFLAKENRDLEGMTQKQAAEVTKTELRSTRLSAQMSAHLAELHQFLRKKEEEAKKQLEDEEKNAVKSMWRNTSKISEELMEGKSTECILKSALDISQPDHFLQWWNEKGFSVIEGMKQKDNTDTEIKYKSKLEGLHVIPNSLFFGPYETHLQFFVWKEMLGAVKPVPESLSIKDPADSYLKVAPGGAHVWQAERKSNYFKGYNPGVVSTETFQTGQHYWEIEVGKKLDWSIGVKMEKEQQKASSKFDGIHLHLRHGKGYIFSSDGIEIPAVVQGNPSKIGLYLDCERKQISFYDADVMSLILLTGYSSDLPCSISLFSGLYLDGTNNDPITICSYKCK